MLSRALNITTGLLIESSIVTWLSQIAIKAELFKKRYINQDSILLDTAYFNHLFNNKKWVINYKDIKLLFIDASNKGIGAIISQRTI